MIACSCNSSYYRCQMSHTTCLRAKSCRINSEETEINVPHLARPPTRHSTCSSSSLLNCSQMVRALTIRPPCRREALRPQQDRHRCSLMPVSFRAEDYGRQGGHWGYCRALNTLSSLCGELWEQGLLSGRTTITTGSCVGERRSSDPEQLLELCVRRHRVHVSCRWIGGFGG